MNHNPYASPAEVASIEDEGPARVEVAWDEQRQVNKLLTRSLVFSFYWLLGFGSLYAIYCAWQARRIIHESEFALRGSRKSIVCLVLGGLGLSFWLLFGAVQLAAIVVNG